MGIVCPRKNQAFTVQCFKAMAGARRDVRLLVVGARYSRDYEIEYVEEVRRAIDGDDRIELHDVTHDVDKFYAQADVVVLASKNEVTPMVIAEGMARRRAVITSGIAGIPEMLDDGVEGFICAEDDVDGWAARMKQLADDQGLRTRMGDAGVLRYQRQFTESGMMKEYRQVATELVSPVILVDMDGTLVDWDSGFMTAWGGRCPVDRSASYNMEHCVPADRRKEAEALFTSEGFFLNLPPMEGGVEALQQMRAAGYSVFICTTPVMSSRFCCQEKWEWVRRHLGEDWLSRVLVTMNLLRLALPTPKQGTRTREFASLPT